MRKIDSIYKAHNNIVLWGAAKVNKVVLIKNTFGEPASVVGFGRMTSLGGGYVVENHSDKDLMFNGFILPFDSRTFFGRPITLPPHRNMHVNFDQDLVLMAMLYGEKLDSETVVLLKQISYARQLRRIPCK